MKPLSIEGAWSYDARVFHDERGSFHETFRSPQVRTVTGRDLPVEQVNCSVSRQGVIRGVHYADVPPGQGKYVMCLRGAVLDAVVDVRVGSPTFGAWETVELSEVNRRAVFLSEGLGHAFQALTDEATVLYLCSASYDPERERGIDPLDADLGIGWRQGLAPVLSARDTLAVSLAQAEREGLLPSYAECARARPLVP
ncbi:dTDP-4-dehydrorhamnose 3,5-epimerase family protein [Streptomyces sp. NBC_01304]|uniref:dTDP-4-dehydrorhamnose 3,5-epimerase family protein n=1 Tax=Streptomyces sp. NBC_01304 TaxID=2903818 RepID=UPI002E1485E7|nr:dTDP-4-dehydrorhamnose 3,5-epimerase [Streptomyces sp. NBC_01304]